MVAKVYAGIDVIVETSKSELNLEISNRKKKSHPLSSGLPPMPLFQIKHAHCSATLTAPWLSLASWEMFAMFNNLLELLVS